MAQSFTLSNFFPINDITAWPDLFAKLEYAKGSNVASYPAVLEFNVTNGGWTDKGIWKLEHAEVDGVKGIKASMDGEEKINDPLHGIRSAENLVEMLLALHEANGQKRMACDVRTDSEAREAAQTLYNTFNNWYQITDELGWLETTGKLKQFGDIEKGEEVTIKTSCEGLTTGVYVVQMVNRDGHRGIEVKLDGAPLFNYPRPSVRSACQIIEVILKLRGMYVDGVRPRDFQYNFKDGSVVVASHKSATGTEVKFFENGLITITSPGFIKFNTEQSQAITEGLVSLVDEAVQPFQDK